jgi:hypothetical protein
MAIVVHDAEIELRDGVALIGWRTQKPQRGSVVALALCSVSVLKRPCRHGCGKAQTQDDSGENVLEYGLHGLRSLAYHSFGPLP